MEMVDDPVSLTPVPEVVMGADYYVADQSLPRPEDMAIQADLRRQVRNGLSALNPKEEMVIQHRFGIGLEHDFTLREVGEKMALSYERVRQIGTEALRKLQQTYGDTLADFSERSREDQPDCADAGR